MRNKSDGFLIIDKPADISSAKVVSQVKKLLGAAKVGHTGTLDPFATGVLVCCINNATRLSRFLTHDKKTYSAVIKLGIETDTQDLTGNIISSCNKVNFSSSELEMTFKRFEGEIKQQPPVYSALKHKGVPLYKLARKGKPVQKKPRRVFISYIKILKISLPLVHFEVSCSSGTYIRTLCADIGNVLGCGACLKELRRVENNGFKISEALTLEEVRNLNMCNRLSARVINMSNPLDYMPGCIADDFLAAKLKHGHTITKKDIALKQAHINEGCIKVLDKNDNLMAILKMGKNSEKYQYCCVFLKYC
jgi:tRNA pseudouridine55 synthase